MPHIFFCLMAFFCVANFLHAEGEKRNMPAGYYVSDGCAIDTFRKLSPTANKFKRLGYGYDGKVFRVDTPEGPVSYKKFTSDYIAQANYELYELLLPLAGDPTKNGLDVVAAEKTDDPTVLKLTYVDAATWTPELQASYWKAIKKFERALSERYAIDVIESSNPDWGCVVMTKDKSQTLGELALHLGNVLYDTNRKVFVIIDPM
jgi:hypothetical protein